MNGMSVLLELSEGACASGPPHPLPEGTVSPPLHLVRRWLQGTNKETESKPSSSADSQSAVTLRALDLLASRSLSNTFPLFIIQSTAVFCYSTRNRLRHFMYFYIARLLYSILVDFVSFHQKRASRSFQKIRTLFCVFCILGTQTKNIVVLINIRANK